VPHPLVDNQTPHHVALLQLTDEQAVAQVVLCVQASLVISPGGLSPVTPPLALPIGGKWRGDPATTSMVNEPQIAFTKPGTDVVLRGHAWAPQPGATEGMVGIRVGALQKTAQVFGDRRYQSRFGIVSISRPEPFQRIPIIAERAFGGWDRRDEDPRRHGHEPRNPVGRGYLLRAPDGDDHLLPNFEDPQDLIGGWSDRPAPACFGFMGPEWQPRLSLAGTYDEAWARTRKPLLPQDFDRRFFNAAAPGLVSQAPLRGDEEVVVVGCSAQQRVAFRLPYPQPPQCQAEMVGGRWVDVALKLDTVTVDMDLGVVTMLWRGAQPSRNGLHDVRSVVLRPSAQRGA
jgi:hypothetical protein